MDARSIVTRKRDGAELSRAEIQAFLGGYCAGAIPDYQASALLMAIFLRGMTPRETEDWTAAMVASGESWSFAGLRRPTADKHSTGGVGDKVSLALAPAVAACGVCVPMVSGRGLGHTGGTLDKLESIPGFRTGLSREEFRRCLETTGLAFGAQTAELVPADRKLYALRDVTGLIESIPLIASSILSKKLAEGAGALVFDVKYGSGAFLAEPERGAELARTLIALARASGRRAAAFQTAMDRPLGLTAGNALEVREAIDCLRGEGPEDLRELVLLLGAEMLVLAGAEAGHEAAARRIEGVLSDGKALAAMSGAIRAQGGDPRVLEEPEELLPVAAPEPFRAARDGWLCWRDVRELGWAVCDLGGGRRELGQAIDPAVGLTFCRRAGERIARGDPVVLVHARDRVGHEAAARRLELAMEIADGPGEISPLVLARVEV